MKKLKGDRGILLKEKINLMLKEFVNFFSRKELITSKSGKIILILISLTISFAWLFIIKSVHNPKGHQYYVSNVDLRREIKATENLINNGVMDFGERDWIFRVPDKNDYTFRMPGFIALYYPLHLYFGQHTALTILIIFSIIIHAISAYLLGRISIYLFNKAWLFYFTFFIYLSCSLVIQYNFGFNREGWSTSLLIIAVFFIFKWFEKKNIAFLYVYSLIMTWIVFLRPFLLPLFLFFNVLILYYLKKEKLHGFLKVFAALFLCLFISLSAWTIRNYTLTGKLILLETSWGPPTYEKVFQDFHAAIGGNMVYWTNNTSGTWFFPEETLNEWGLKNPSDDVIPEWIFSKELTKDTLLKSRDLFWQSLQTNKPDEKQKLLLESQHILKRFTSHVKKAHPFRYYFLNPLKSIWNLIYHPHGLSLRGLTYPINVVMTFTDNFIKYFIFFLGIIASFFLFFKYYNKSLFIWFPVGIIGFLYLFLGLYFQDPEHRRIANAFPFLLVMATGLLSELNMLKLYKRIIIYTGMLLLFSVMALHQVITLINW